MNVVIEQQTDLPSDALAVLVAESEREGWRFVRRLIDEWASGDNRFDQPGERLFLARTGGAVIGVCGLNVDTYAAVPGIGRLRRLYVLRAYRRHDVGRRLVEAVARAAGGWFHCLRLRTESPEAARFYERRGFQAVDGVPDCTHILQLAE